MNPLARHTGVLQTGNHPRHESSRSTNVNIDFFRVNSSKFQNTLRGVSTFNVRVVSFFGSVIGNKGLDVFVLGGEVLNFALNARVQLRVAGTVEPENLLLGSNLVGGLNHRAKRGQADTASQKDGGAFLDRCFVQNKAANGRSQFELVADFNNIVKPIAEQAVGRSILTGFALDGDSNFVGFGQARDGVVAGSDRARDRRRHGVAVDGGVLTGLPTAELAFSGL